MGAVFRLDGTSTGAVKAVSDLGKALKEIEGKAELSTREMTKLEKQAQRVAEQADPQRKYNRQLEELSRLVKAGKISMQDAEMIAKRYGQQLDNVGQRGKEAFGHAMLNRVAAMAAGYLSVTGAVRTFARALTQAEESAQGAADKALAAIDRIGKLQQLANAPELAAFAVRLVGEGVAPDAGVGADIAFALQSSSLTDEEKEFFAIRVGRSKAIPTSEMATTATNVKKAQNQLQLGSFQETMAKLVVASEVTDTTLSAIAEATTRFGLEAEGAGFTGDQDLAGIVAILKSSPNPEQAATRFRAFARKVDQLGLKEGGLLSTVDAITARIAKGETDFDILPDEEARAGYRALVKNREVMRQVFKSVIAAPDEDPVASRFGELERVDPNFRAAVRRQRAEGRRDVSRMGVAEKENIFEQMLADMETSGRRGGQSEFMIAFDRMFLRLFDILGAERRIFETEADNMNLSAETRQTMNDYLRRTAEGVEKMNSNRNPVSRQE